jgi:hypothetical protein
MECGYALRGLTESRCPECGCEFDPENRETMNLGRPMGPMARWWIQPPGWGLNGAVLANAAWSLVAFSVPKGYFLLAIPALIAWFGLGVAWLVRLGVSALIA